MVSSSRSSGSGPPGLDLQEITPPSLSRVQQAQLGKLGFQDLKDLKDLKAQAVAPSWDLQ